MRAAIKFAGASILASAFVGAGCSKSPSGRPSETGAMGRSLNPVRLELGLRPIGKSWVLYRLTGAQEDWVVKKGSPTGKTIFKDKSGNVVSEEDHLYSGKKYYYRHDEGWEFMAVRFDYLARTVSVTYSGTNTVTESAMAAYLVPPNAPTHDIKAATGCVRAATASWPGSDWTE